MKHLLASTLILATLSLHAQYKVENIELPKDRHDTKQIDGLAFTPSGRPVICFPSGTVYIGDKAGKNWTLFAEGLHNPLGIVANSESEIIVCQRPEVTRLTDTDGDGKADFYENLCDDFGISGNYHEFNFGPIKDSKGNLYFGLGTASSGDGIRDIVRGKFNEASRPGRMYSCVPYRGWVMKLTPEGKMVPFGSGIRTPNGLGFDKQERIFVSDNQGDWVGTSKLFHVEEGKFYGHVSSLAWREGFTGVPLKVPVPELNKMRTPAAIRFPHGIMANSPTQPLRETSNGAFSPFQDQLLVGEMNSARIVRCMLEEVGGQLQGACTPFLDKTGLTNGNNRLAFAPDNSLWVGHTKHTWAGNEGLQRIVRTKDPLFEVHTLSLTKDGFDLTMTDAVDPKSIPAAKDWVARRYFYEYHSKYGSKQFEVSPVIIESATLQADKKTIHLKISGLKAERLYEFKLPSLTSAGGTAIKNKLLVYTANKLR